MRQIRGEGLELVEASLQPLVEVGERARQIANFVSSPDSREKGSAAARSRQHLVGGVAQPAQWSHEAAREHQHDQGRSGDRQQNDAKQIDANPIEGGEHRLGGSRNRDRAADGVVPAHRNGHRQHRRASVRTQAAFRTVAPGERSQDGGAVGIAAASGGRLDDRTAQAPEGCPDPVQQGVPDPSRRGLAGPRTAARGGIDEQPAAGVENPHASSERSIHPRQQGRRSRRYEVGRTGERRRERLGRDGDRAFLGDQELALEDSERPESDDRQNQHQQRDREKPAEEPRSHRLQSPSRKR